MPVAKESPAMKNEKGGAKLVYRLEEVSRMANLDPKTIDTWEKEFPFLQPGFTASGRKIFRRKDLEIILRIKELIEKKGYTLAGAKRRIEEEFGVKTPTNVHPDKMRKVLWQVKEQLLEIAKSLEKSPKKP